jgi:phosphoglycerate dehydrogenase-like enzyme
MGTGSPLYALDNIILMPHVAGLTLEAVEGMSLSAARQVLQALAGECPPHILNRAAWPAAAARAKAAALTL